MKKFTVSFSVLHQTDYEMTIDAENHADAYAKYESMKDGERIANAGEPTQVFSYFDFENAEEVAE